MKEKYKLIESGGKQILFGNLGNPLITFLCDDSCNRFHVLYDNSNIDKEFQWDYAEKTFGKTYDCGIECGSKEEFMLCQSRFIELVTNGFVSESRRMIGMDWLDLERESFKTAIGQYFHIEAVPKDFDGAVALLTKTIKSECSKDLNYIICIDGAIGLFDFESAISHFDTNSRTAQLLYNGNAEKINVDVWVFQKQENDEI